jgi:hypothetical protein
VVIYFPQVPQVYTEPVAGRERKWDDHIYVITSINPSSRRESKNEKNKLLFKSNLTVEFRLLI